jgi:DNA polymerase V
MPSGGKRIGAGRPSGGGKYGEVTKPVRIPQTMIDKVMAFVNNKGYELPMYNCKISAGFPSPADDHMEKKLDLNEYLVKTPSATFFVRATGDSMINAGIYDDDILVVDRSLQATSGKIIIAALNGMLTVKRLYKKQGVTLLLPENDKYQPIEIKEGEELHIWGVVTNVIHSV